MCVHMRAYCHVQLFATPWTVACQPPLSMKFSRQDCWSGLPFPSPGDLCNPGIEPPSLVSPTLAGRFFTSWATREAQQLIICHIYFSINHLFLLLVMTLLFLCCLVTKLCQALYDPRLQQARLLCPPLSPGVCSNSCPLSRWCYLTTSSSATPFSFCLQSSPASESFPMSQLFTSGGLLQHQSFQWIFGVDFL